jgi:hypothetical protein
MPFSLSQFTDTLNSAKTNWQADNGSFNPPSGYSSVPDLNATQIFSTYSATIGSANLSAAFKTIRRPSCPWIYSAGSWFGGNNLQRVCLHDVRWEGPPTSANVTRRGNCVAISKRHLLVSAHGSDPEGGTLQWLSDSGTINRITSYTYVANVGDVVGGSQDGFFNGYRVLRRRRKLADNCRRLI